MQVKQYSKPMERANCFHFMMIVHYVMLIFFYVIMTFFNVMLIQFIVIMIVQYDIAIFHCDDCYNESSFHYKNTL